MSFSSESLHKSLKNIFGFNSFKGRQEKIIKTLLEEKDYGDHVNRRWEINVLSITSAYIKWSRHSNFPINCTNEKSS